MQLLLFCCSSDSQKIWRTAVLGKGCKHEYHVYNKQTTTTIFTRQKHIQAPTNTSIPLLDFVASCGRICGSRRVSSKSDKTRLSEIKKWQKRQLCSKSLKISPIHCEQPLRKCSEAYFKHTKSYGVARNFQSF